VKEAVFQIKFNIKNIWNIFCKNENGKLEGLINLLNPPEFFSNFLKLPSEDDQNYEYERTIFPMKNFLSPFDNLKFRNFSLLFEMDEFNDIPGSEERNKDVLDNILKDKENQALKFNKYTIKDPPNKVSI